MKKKFEIMSNSSINGRFVDSAIFAGETDQSVEEIEKLTKSLGLRNSHFSRNDGKLSLYKICDKHELFPNTNPEETIVIIFPQEPYYGGCNKRCHSARGMPAGPYTCQENLADGTCRDPIITGLLNGLDSKLYS